MIIELKTEIPFKRGETFSVRNGSGKVVENWECISWRDGVARFHVQGYQSAFNI